jgi:hypothetical protein
MRFSGENGDKNSIHGLKKSGVLLWIQDAANLELELFRV